MSLYKVQKKDIKKAGETLANAFEHDPVWKAILEKCTFKQKSLFWASPIQYGLKYGEVWATSEEIEGVIVWLPSEYSVMNMKTIFGSGLAFKRQGVSLRKMIQIGKIMSPLDKEKKRILSVRKYLYLYVVGVKDVHQGKGFGKRLINAYMEQIDKHNIIGYLETATRENVRLYNKFGFDEVNTVNHPIIHLPQYQMIREIKKT